MKRLAIGVSLVMVLFSVASLVPLRAQQASAPGQDATNGAPLPANPLKVAILHWYRANRTTSVKVGQQPYGLAFDGENIWSANNADGTVSKVRASDGENLGMFHIGIAPMGLAWDGANMWVTDNDDIYITKLRGSDGKVLGKFEIGSGAWFPAFDGENIWVGNGLQNSVLYKLRASDGKKLGQFPVGVFALAFDGTYIWLTTSGNGLNVIRLKRDGSNAGSFQVGANPQGLAFDGENIWVASSGDSTVIKLRAKDGAILGTFDVPTLPYTVAFDGTNIWVTGSPFVVELRPSDGAELGRFRTPGSSSVGAAFDGANLWIAAPFDNAIFKF